MATKMKMDAKTTAMMEQCARLADELADILYEGSECVCYRTCATIYRAARSVDAARAALEREMSRAKTPLVRATIRYELTCLAQRPH